MALMDGGNRNVTVIFHRVGDDEHTIDNRPSLHIEGTSTYSTYSTYAGIFEDSTERCFIDLYFIPHVSVVVLSIEIGCC